MDRITSGWRMGQHDGGGVDGGPLTAISPEPGKTLFETIEQSSLADHETFVVERRELVFAMLNIYPYNPGHLMVLPKRAVSALSELSDDEYRELWDLVRIGSLACESAFNPDGLNVGLNQGTAAGASQPTHLHVHIVPRWEADTNFATAVADIRVLPMTLQDAWERIRDVWPASNDAEPSSA